MYEWDTAVFRESLRKCQGQLVFLQNLSQTERDGAGGKGHQCPVCTQEIKDKVSDAQTKPVGVCFFP